MIKAEGNKVCMEGDHIELLTNLTMIVNSLNEHLTRKYEDAEDAKDMIEEAIRIGFLSEEEKHKEVMDVLKGDKLDEILEKLERVFK